jgi:hypothetical protein
MGPIVESVTMAIKISLMTTESERLEYNLVDVMDRWKGALLLRDEELGMAMYRNMRSDTKSWEEL